MHDDDAGYVRRFRPPLLSPGGSAAKYRPGSWVSSASGGYGSGMNWWWDVYLTPKNLWSGYRGLSRVLRTDAASELNPVRAPRG